MNEAKAREILRKMVEPDDSLSWDFEFVSWRSGVDNSLGACLDGHFQADVLEAIAWWMRNKGNA